LSELCETLHRWLNTRTRYRFPFDAAAIPRNGIYVLFETGELAHGGDRVVRVGTHTGQNQLRSRLQQHFILENKDRSIFRKNIGRALLARDGDPFAAYWELDRTARLARQQPTQPIDRDRQKEIERDVSRCIQQRFSFVAFEVLNKTDRLSLESRIISTIAACPDCKPSAHWLGLSSPKPKIRDSGLWQVNELYKQPFTAAELQRLIRTGV
jgi:hypothetical protein